MYSLTQNLTTVNYTKGTGVKKENIVVHYTGNNTDTAKANANYFKSVNRGASAHYFVDETTVVQVVNDEDISWAVGKNYGSNNLFGVVTNANSINIEMCSVNGKIADGTFANTVTLVKSLMKKHGISANKVYRHYDICSKTCPGWTGWGTKKGDKGELWANFKNQLSEQEGKVMAEVQLYTINNTDAQKWYKKTNSDGTYSFENKASGLYLDVAGGQTKAGAKIQVYKKNGTNSQKFILSQYSGYSPSYVAPLMITPVVAKNCVLDCVSGGTVNGTKIQTYTKNNTNAQKWQVLDNGDGTWTFMNIGSHKALDVVGGGK